MATVKVGQVYENKAIRVEVLKVGDPWIRCQVVYKNTNKTRKLDFEEEQLLKMRKIKG
jgi:hypothetical protein